MGSCCDTGGYDETFGADFAHRVARRCGRRGLGRTRTRIVDLAGRRGLEGATVLEIGGGVGELHIELLRRGARTATNLEISTGYDAEAARLLEESGLGDRVTRRRLDIAEAPDEVGPADVVVLHRVVCCYPDYERLLDAAASHARRLLVFSYPSGHLLNRALIGCENLIRRVEGNVFRAFVHPPERMVAVAESRGLVVAARHRSPVWSVVALERPEEPGAAA